MQGGMILCGVLARVDITTAKIRSCICMGSGLFLEGARTGTLFFVFGAEQRVYVFA
jgi:hypothetical protein